jgi:hypothetical protein
VASFCSVTLGAYRPRAAVVRAEGPRTTGECSSENSRREKKASGRGGGAPPASPVPPLGRAPKRISNKRMGGGAGREHEPLETRVERDTPGVL